MNKPGRCTAVYQTDFLQAIISPTDEVAFESGVKDRYRCLGLDWVAEVDKPRGRAEKPASHFASIIAGSVTKDDYRNSTTSTIIYF